MLKGGKGKTNTSQVNSPDRLNRIVEGTHIKGDIKTDSNFRIDGELVGTLDTMGKLVIGGTGRIEGEVKCGNADVEGEIIGNIHVDGVLMLKSTAKVIGNIKAGKLGIENGAQFNGKCDMGAKIETTRAEVNVEEDESELVY